MKRALITGISGQAGSYLAEFLLDKDYAVHGLLRRGSTFSTERIEHLFPHQASGRLTLHHGDLLDPHTLRAAVLAARPDEVYHLAALSHVAESFAAPAYALDVITRGTLYVLEACRELVQQLGVYARTPKLYVASTSEMFGDAPAPQSEETPFRPRSPYAVAKVAAHHMAGLYREAYGMRIARGILFNHESPRRLPTFVTRKITHGLARIKCGLDERLVLGNLKARRDWGHARDYVRAMWLMLQQDEPGDFVVATGDSTSVEEFLSRAAEYTGIYWPDVVTLSTRYERPLEVPDLRGDASKAASELGWRPATTLDQMIVEMVHHDLRLASRLASQQAARGRDA